MSLRRADSNYNDVAIDDPDIQHNTVTQPRMKSSNVELSTPGNKAVLVPGTKVLAAHHGFPDEDTQPGPGQRDKRKKEILPSRAEKTQRWRASPGTQLHKSHKRIKETRMWQDSVEQ